MASDRWDPFREAVSLRDAMNALLQESFIRPSDAGGAGVGTLPLDIAETEDAFIVQASLPGVRPEDVQITVHGDTLTIRAESKPDEDRPGQTWLLRERRFGAAQRAVALSAPVDTDKANAQYHNGVLTLTLPKSERAKPRQIKVGTGPG